MPEKPVHGTQAGSTRGGSRCTHGPALSARVGRGPAPTSGESLPGQLRPTGTMESDAPG